MNGVNISSNEDFTSNTKLKLYKDIFGESPWNEGFVCQVCGQYYPKTFMGKCSCGECSLEPFYKNTDLKESFSKISSQLGYSELIADILGENVGFIWGWNTNIDNLNSSKLDLEEDELSKLNQNIKEEFEEFDFEDFYYFAEVGVKKDFRGKSIAGNLYRENMDQVKQSGTRYILVRTTKNAKLPYSWFVREGFQEVYLYGDSQNRVILVKDLYSEIK